MIPNISNENREYWIRQSEMLQSAISRMANNSLEIKKVGLTVWAAIVGFGFTSNNRSLFVLAFIAFILFGVLDIYYLFLERKLRSNFNRLTRILSGYEISENDEWLEQMRGNFVKPEASPNFLEQLPKILKSWANLPYLITFFITLCCLSYLCHQNNSITSL